MVTMICVPMFSFVIVYNMSMRLCTYCR